MSHTYVLDGVRTHREKNGLSAAELARRVGITERSLSGIETKAHGARRKILIGLRDAINKAAGNAAFEGQPVLAPAGTAKPGQTSTSQRFPKGIRVEFTKKRNRAVRPA